MPQQQTQGTVTAAHPRKALRRGSLPNWVDVIKAAAAAKSIAAQESVAAAAAQTTLGQHASSTTPRTRLTMRRGSVPEHTTEWSEDEEDSPDSDGDGEPTHAVHLNVRQEGSVTMPPALRRKQASATSRRRRKVTITFREPWKPFETHEERDVSLMRIKTTQRPQLPCSFKG